MNENFSSCLSLRDSVAIAIIGSMPYSVGLENFKAYSEEYFKRRSEIAYKQAEAMLKEREKYAIYKKKK